MDHTGKRVEQARERYRAAQRVFNKTTDVMLQENKDIKDDLTKKKNDIETLRSDIDRYENTITGLMTRLEEKETHHAALAIDGDTITALERTNKDLEKRLNRKRDEADCLRETIMVLEQQLAAEKKKTIAERRKTLAEKKKTREISAALDQVKKMVNGLGAVGVKEEEHSGSEMEE